jgi:predicted AlkP superfamily pyrophosphatase or phosphodiesterase
MYWIKLLLLVVFGFLSRPNTLFGQTNKESQNERPKLVVGIVVDQMRYDYLYKYWAKYGEKGFKRLLKEGYSFENTHYNYVPTYTGPGHASIFTGSTPAFHGIIGNDWFVRATNKAIYVTEDKSVKTVGSDSHEGEMSPRNLLATTITDELRLFSNQKSRVIGIAIKDRGAILPAGHAANSAYWYDRKTGNWITSSYYMQQLPDWVNKFNSQRLPSTYLAKSWETILPIEQYTASTADDMSFELAFDNELKPVFPHHLPKINEGKKTYELLVRTPFGNSFTTDFAIEALKNEKLGKGEFTDFLTLSFSSNDYVGHQFGPNSIEVEDTYLRLDKEMERLLAFIDEIYKKENVLLFLSADHGAAHNPTYLKSLGVPSGLLNLSCIDSLKNHLNKVYGKEQWVSYYENQQVYLNHTLIQQKGIHLLEVQLKAAQYLRKFEGISQVIEADALSSFKGNPVIEKIQLGYYQKRSGDVLILLEPGWMDEPFVSKGGTSHGSPYNYDTHVPLLWYGWKIAPGKSNEEVSVTDIAPTLASLLRINEPNACIGKTLLFQK